MITAKLTLMVALALQQPAPPQDPNPPEQMFARVAIASYVVAGFADLSTTMYGIGQGTLVERNPLLKPFADDPIHIGIAKGVLTAGTAYILVKLHKRHPRWTTVIASASAGITAWAAFHNRRELTR